MNKPTLIFVTLMVCFGSFKYYTLSVESDRKSRILEQQEQELKNLHSKLKKEQSRDLTEVAVQKERVNQLQLLLKSQKDSWEGVSQRLQSQRNLGVENGTSTMLQDEVNAQKQVILDLQAQLKLVAPNRPAAFKIRQNIDLQKAKQRELEVQLKEAKQNRDGQKQTIQQLSDERDALKAKIQETESELMTQKQTLQRLESL